MEIGVIGDLYVDITVRGITHFPEKNTDLAVPTISPALGGSAFNVARHLNSLGHRVRFISSIGEDIFTDLVQNRMLKEGIINSTQVVPGKNTASCLILYPPNVTTPAYAFCKGALADLKVEKFSNSLYQPLGHLHVTGFYDIEGFHSPHFVEQLRKLQEEGTTISLDPQLTSNWKNEALFEILKTLDYFFANRVEATNILGEEDQTKSLGDLARGLREKFKMKGVIIIKDGEFGALADWGEKSVHCEAVLPKEVIDSCGAGDAFAAAFLHGRLGLHQSFEECLRLGNLAGAFVVSYSGSATHLLSPSILELDQINK